MAMRSALVFAALVLLCVLYPRDAFASSVSVSASSASNGETKVTVNGQPVGVGDSKMGGAKVQYTGSASASSKKSGYGCTSQSVSVSSKSGEEPTVKIVQDGDCDGSGGASDHAGTFGHRGRPHPVFDSDFDDDDHDDINLGPDFAAMREKMWRGRFGTLRDGDNDADGKQEGPRERMKEWFDERWGSDKHREVNADFGNGMRAHAQTKGNGEHSEHISAHSQPTSSGGIRKTVTASATSKSSQ